MNMYNPESNYKVSINVSQIWTNTRIVITYRDFYYKYDFPGYPNKLPKYQRLQYSRYFSELVIERTPVAVILSGILHYENPKKPFYAEVENIKFSSRGLLP